MINFKICFGFVSCLFPIFIEAKVRILTFHYNEPEFIEYQVKCLRRFFLDDWELLVFNDAAADENARLIQETCSRLQIPCIRFQPEWHEQEPLNRKIFSWLQTGWIKCSHFSGMRLKRISLKQIAKQPSIRHAHVIQYALQHFGYMHDDIVIIMDGDAFFVKPFSVKQQMKDLSVEVLSITVPENKGVVYPWVVFVAFNPTKLPHVNTFSCNLTLINGRVHDTGSQMYHYLKAHPSVRVWMQPREFFQIAPNCQVELNMTNSVLHFSGSSFNNSGHDVKKSELKQYLDAILGVK